MILDAKIVGFGRSSDRMEVALDIPPDALAAVMRIAEVPDSDPELIGTYPLNERQLAMIAETVHMTVDPLGLSYFLEANAD